MLEVFREKATWLRNPFAWLRIYSYAERCFFGGEGESINPIPAWAWTARLELSTHQLGSDGDPDLELPVASWTPWRGGRKKGRKQLVSSYWCPREAGRVGVS